MPLFIFEGVSYVRTIQTELVQKELGKKEQGQESKRRQPKNSKMSRREVEELMGINRVTYKRVNGAVRRK